MMNREYGIDSIRIVAAFFIISHHIAFPSLPIVGSMFIVGGSWALFYFFIISGYFLSYKDFLSERSMKTITRLISISIVWSVIYVPINIFDYGLSGGIKYFLNNTLLNYYHLWFLVSLIIGFLFLNYFELKNLSKYKFLVSAGIILYYFASTKTLSYAHIIPFDLPESLIYLFLGIPWILYGNYLTKSQPLKISICIILIIIGYAICFLEGSFLGFRLHYLGDIPIVIGVVNFALNKPKILNWGKLSTYGGRYGLGIYLIHPYIIYIIKHLNRNLNLNLEGKLYDFTQPFIIIFLSGILFHICYLFFPKLYKLLTGNQKKICIERPLEINI